MPQRAKFELGYFEDLFQYQLLPEALIAISEDPARSLTELKMIKTEITDNVRRVRNEFRDLMVRGYTDVHLEGYFQRHQHETIRLMNLAYNLIDVHELYDFLFKALAMLLDCIEKDYSKYFDLTAPVPDSYYQSSILLLEDNRKVIYGKMKAKQVEPVLQEVILAYLRNFIKREACTFRELIYAKRFVAHLLKILKDNKEKDWTLKLIKELLYLNFNKVSFLKHCRYVMAAEVEAIKNLPEQMTRFHQFSKEIEKLDIKPNVAYRTEREGLKEHLMSYVAAELVYLSEWKKLHPELAGQDFKVRAEQVGYKLPLSLSVPELAYIAQLFIDVGVFVVEKGQIMTVMKFFADHVKTRGTDQAKAVQLYKHRNPEVRTRDAVEAILIDMLSRLRGGDFGMA